jgi:twitching motility protein PilI
MNTEEYQHALKGQIEKAGKNDNSAAVLGVAVGDERYLIPMTEVSEVIPIPKLARVPLTQSWFIGLANVRGNLYGITDLGAYLNDYSAPFNMKSRILLVSPGNRFYGGFIVNSMLGIRSLAEFTPLKPKIKKLSQGVIAQYKDAEERLWWQLSLFELIRDERFLQIARE